MFCALELVSDGADSAYSLAIKHKARVAWSARYLHEVYTRADPTYSGRVTVPVLWDKQTGTIVNNESSEIIRMFNTAFDGIGAKAGDYYPEALRAEIDDLNERIYATVNNSVYRAGFATTQEAYEEAVGPLFETLDWLEDRLSSRRYLTGQRHHRSRLAAGHDADPLRSRLCRPFQMQHPANCRLSAPLPTTCALCSGSRASPRPWISATSSATTTRATAI